VASLQPVGLPPSRFGLSLQILPQRIFRPSAKHIESITDPGHGIPQDTRILLLHFSAAKKCFTALPDGALLEYPTVESSR
jgi:hypothetical protein